MKLKKLVLQSLLVSICMIPSATLASEINIDDTSIAHPHPNRLQSNIKDYIILGWSNTMDGDTAKATADPFNTVSSIVGPHNKLTNARNAYIVGRNNNIGTSTEDSNKVSVVGTYNTLIGERSNVLGHNNQLRLVNQATVLGNYNNTTGDYTYILGSDIETSDSNSVILGHRSASREFTSVSSATVGKLQFNGFAGATVQTVDGHYPKDDTPMSSGVVSIGADKNERQLIYVAAGQVDQNSTDAINGSQLYATNNVLNNTATSVSKLLGGNAALASDGTITYTNIGGTNKDTVEDAIASNVAAINSNTTAIERNTRDIVNMQQATHHLQKRINKVGAGAAALAALHPMAFNDNDKWTFSVGYGNLHNANAVALGSFYQPNENLMFNVAGTVGNGDNMFNAGVSIKVGSSSKANVAHADTLAQDVEALKRIVQQQQEEIQSLREALDTKNR